MKFVPVLCGASFKNKGVQALLDAVIDYLPSPMDVHSRCRGICRTHDETLDERDVCGRRAVRGARVQDRDGSVRREADLLPRVFGRAEDRLVRLQLERRTSASASARLLQMHANKREEIEEVRAGDIARGDRAQGHAHRRHAVRRRQADHARGDEVPGPRHRRRDRAEDEGRPGQARRSRWRSCPRRIRPSACTPIAETGQTIISGMGELHLEILVDRMQREFKVDANIGRPQVAYRETIRKRVEKVEGKFIRQSGGRGPVRPRRHQHQPARAGPGLRVRGQDRRAA